MDIDFDELTLFLETLENTDFSYFLYEKQGLRIEVRRGPVPEPAHPHQTVDPIAAESAKPAPSSEVSTSPTTPTTTAIVKQEGDIEVTAQMLGTVYLSPKPGEAAFVQLGGTVESGATLCIVEVMKLMNSVESPLSGTVIAIHVHDGDLVEFGDPLVTIRPDAR